jgi:hypothetical protein
MATLAVVAGQSLRFDEATSALAAARVARLRERWQAACGGIPLPPGRRQADIFSVALRALGRDNPISGMAWAQAAAGAGGWWVEALAVLAAGGASVDFPSRVVRVAGSQPVFPLPRLYRGGLPALTMDRDPPNLLIGLLQRVGPRPSLDDDEVARALALLAPDEARLRACVPDLPVRHF